MPEAKNNFLKGRMNKDVDERLLQDGEYRDARNISVSNSDTGNSGSVENVLGNVELSNLGLTDSNLEIIGVYDDVENNRIILFVTNYTDSSPNKESNRAPSTSAHYIVAYDISTGDVNKLVQGSFLNFSKTHPVLSITRIEDLLFWTDNRNQPRKINVKKALGNSSNIDDNPYYSTEDNISLAKYYPWNPIRLYRFNGGALNTYNSDILRLFDSQSFESATLSSTTTYTYDIPSASTPESSTSGSGTGAEIELQTDGGGNISSITVVSGGSGFQVGDTITLVDPTGLTSETIQITLTKECLDVTTTMFDSRSKLLPYSAQADTPLGGFGSGTSNIGTLDRVDSSQDLLKFSGCLIYAVDSNGDEIVSISDGVSINSISYTTGDRYTVLLSSPVNLSSASIVYMGANPYYDAELSPRDNNLRDKFVRFSYRFKYDDGEYSLMSPFTQPVFIPKQDGYFMGDSSNIDSDERKAYMSSIVQFFENKVTKAELVIDLPNGVSTVGELWDYLNIDEVEILYKASDEPSVKVVDTLKRVDFINSTDTEIVYEYNSIEPTKVLPEREITRVYDKVPVKTKAIETVGNRIVMSNYLPPRAPISSLDFSVQSGEKGNQVDYLDAFNKIEYPQHTLKQNRPYQVGIVLCDRYGRQSEPITSPKSTIRHNYRSSSQDLLSSDDIYMGDALQISFNEPIPEDSSIDGYAGLYDETSNPTGWYSYKVVVKQLEQSYYTAYVPSILNGYPTGSGGSRVDDIAHITLIGDNISKIPRNLNDVNDEDSIYEANVTIFPRVSASTYVAGEHRTEQYDAINSRDSVISIGTRNNLGLDKEEDGTALDQSAFYGIPTVAKDETGANPFIARVSTENELGVLGGDSADVNYISFNKLYMDVVETAPFKSNIDIFWETSTCGLISELNESIKNSTSYSGVPFSIDALGWNISEATTNNSTVSRDFVIRDSDGSSIVNANTTGEIVSARNKLGVSWKDFFQLEKDNVNYTYSIKWIGGGSKDLVYTDSSDLNDTIDFVLRFTNVVDGNTVANNIVLRDNKLRNIAPFLEEDGDDFGTKTNGVSRASSISLGGGGFTYRLLTGWRSAGDLNFRNGSIYNNTLGVGSQITSLEYYNATTSQWEDYFGHPFILNSSLGANDIRNFVRIISFNGQTGLYYSPLLQSCDVSNSGNNPWQDTPILSSSLRQYAGVFEFGTNDEAQFKLVDSTDASKGVEEVVSGFKTETANVYRFTSGISATDFRVTINVTDANEGGLKSTERVEFSLNTDRII